MGILKQPRRKPLIECIVSPYIYIIFYTYVYHDHASKTRHLNVRLLSFYRHFIAHAWLKQHENTVYFIWLDDLNMVIDFVDSPSVMYLCRRYNLDESSNFVDA